jgi:hypothetical protein
MIITTTTKTTNMKERKENHFNVKLIKLNKI